LVRVFPHVLWALDFGEDYSRKHAGNAAQNYSVVVKVALNLLQNEKSENKHCEIMTTC